MRAVVLAAPRVRAEFRSVADGGAAVMRTLRRGLMRLATSRRMKGMHTPRRVTVLACSFILVSCGALPASERSAPANGAFTAAEVPGTWSLTDDENVTFDVVLS
ncbi:MAG: hypothetical protein EBU31_11415, partial [Proteobacteria bacterium]|nr:hypothetical protein [Pseudomonadota bacterium]